MAVSYCSVTYRVVSYCDVGERYPVVRYGPVSYTDVAVAYRLVTYADVGEEMAPASYGWVTYGAV